MPVNKRILSLTGVFFAFFIFLGAGCGDTEEQKNDSTVKTEPVTRAVNQGAASSVSVSLPEYTYADIQKHTTKEDCWMAIKENVYDVSAYIKSEKHPPSIIDGCGKDATVLFETRPTGSGTPHSQKANEMLKSYLIGTFKK